MTITSSQLQLVAPSFSQSSAGKTYSEAGPGVGVRERRNSVQARLLYTRQRRVSCTESVSQSSNAERRCEHSHHGLALLAASDLPGKYPAGTQPFSAGAHNQTWQGKKKTLLYLHCMACGNEKRRRAVRPCLNARLWLCCSQNLSHSGSWRSPWWLPPTGA
jgi:hypothetical protein